MTASRDATQRWQRLLLLGMGGMVAFLLALAALHVTSFVWPVSPEQMHPGSYVEGFGQPRHISAYALGQGAWNWIWYAGVLCLGLGMIAFAVALKRLLPAVQNSRVSCWLLAEAGACILILDIFPTDATPMPETVFGALHDLAAIASLTLQCSAMVLLTESGSRHPAWQHAVGSSPAWAATATALSIGWGFLDILPEPGWEFGAVVQRAVAVFLVLWMLRVGWRVRYMAPSEAAATARAPAES